MLKQEDLDSPPEKIPHITTSLILSSLDRVMQKVSTEFDRNDVRVVELRTELPKKIYCVLDPDLIAQFFMNKSVSIHKPKGILPREEWLMRGALNADHGDSWKRKRKAMGRLFTPRAIGQFFGPIRPTIESCFSRIDTLSAAGERVNICKETGRFVVDLALQMFFSTQLESDELDVIAELVGELESAMPEQVPLWIPSPDNIRFKRKSLAIRTFLQDLINKRRVSQVCNDDVLSQFLALEDEELGRKWTDEEIIDQLLAVFLGSTAVAVPLYWTAYILATNPQYYNRVNDEFVSMCQDKAIPSPEETNTLKYLDSVFRESMRLYPPFWGNIRYTYEDLEIENFKFPRNSTFLLLRYFANRNPHYWENPQANNPQRFDPAYGEVIKTSYHIPFGAGPRTCIGIHLAPLIAKTFLASFANRYKLSYPSTLPNGTPQISFLYGLYPKQDIFLNIEKK